MIISLVRFVGLGAFLKHIINSHPLSYLCSSVKILVRFFSLNLGHRVRERINGWTRSISLAANQTTNQHTCTWTKWEEIERHMHFVLVGSYLDGSANQFSNGPGPTKNFTFLRTVKLYITSIPLFWNPGMSVKTSQILYIQSSIFNTWKVQGVLLPRLDKNSDTNLYLPSKKVMATGNCLFNTGWLTKINFKWTMS